MTEDTYKILVADDDAKIRLLLAKLLQKDGHEVFEAQDGKQALKLFIQERPDALLVDLKMPGMDGLEVLERIRAEDPDVPVILITAFGDIETAVRAMKAGASDFIVKPHIEMLSDVVKRAVERLGLKKEVKRLSHAVEVSMETLFGRSPAIKKVSEMASRVAPTDMNVILQGEAGTGKKHIARVIHDMSQRAGMPFVSVDVSALPETMVDSELFGFASGIHVGVGQRRGLFELANGGTLILSGLQHMSSYVQSKIMNVIENKEMSQIGSKKPVRVDLRIIAASKSDMKQSVNSGTFREDLYYRLGELVIDVPPLRGRPEDIMYFAGKFLSESSSELSKPVRGFTEDASRRMMRYDWPGNLSQFKNIIKRAVLLSSEGCISTDDLDFLIEVKSKDKAIIPLKDALRDLESAYIEKALEFTGGNKSRAASMLCIDYKTLLYKIKK